MSNRISTEEYQALAEPSIRNQYDNAFRNTPHMNHTLQSHYKDDSTNAQSSQRQQMYESVLGQENTNPAQDKPFLSEPLTPYGEFLRGQGNRPYPPDYTAADLIAKQNKLDEEKTSHYAEGNKRMQYADSRQVSGSHYKDMPIQPWAVMESVLTREEFLGFLRGNVIKYSMRAGRKEGSDDAGKARHYMEKLLEMEQR